MMKWHLKPVNFGNSLLCELCSNALTSNLFCLIRDKQLSCYVVFRFSVGEAPGTIYPIVVFFAGFVF